MTDHHPHETGGKAEGVVNAPRFGRASDVKDNVTAALDNVTKVAQLRARAVAQVEHLDERLSTAIDEAVEAGANKTDAKAAAKKGENS